MDPRLLEAPARTPIRFSAPVFLKYEGGQPGGSVKYRLAHARVAEALRSGELREGMTIVEVSQGYLALALAQVAGRLGLRLELHCGHDIPAPARRQLEGLGAVLHVHPQGTSIAAAFAQIARDVERGGFWHFGQYTRDVLLRGYDPLGREVVEQLREMAGRRPSAFMCPIGTGGLIQGVGRHLRAAFPDVRILAVEAQPGRHFGGTIRNTTDMHMGDADPYDRSFPDATLYLGDEPSEAECASLSQRHGVPLVPSAAAMIDLIEARGYDDVLVITPE